MRLPPPGGPMPGNRSGDAPRDVPVASGGAGFIPFAAAVMPTDTVQTSAATPLQADWTLPLAVVLLAIAGLAVLFRRLLN